MPPKKKISAPIDRPLSRAYLRGFKGWSTAYPPGQSEPSTCRIMENVIVDRNGALQVRGGLKYLSYEEPPDFNATDQLPGVAYTLSPVGGQEPFFLGDGSQALLFAVRELDESVGFRVLLFRGTDTIVYPIDDPAVGFLVPQGTATLNFTEDTTHVTYLQIDNKIMALSDAGEPARLFYVGGTKLAKSLTNISVPAWNDAHKLTLMHPDESWILDKQATSIRRNEVLNPSFERGIAHWTKGKNTRLEWNTSPPFSTSGGRVGQVSSNPERTNLCPSPLHDPTGTGTDGWHSSTKWGNPRLSIDRGALRINDDKGEGLYRAYVKKVVAKAGQKYTFRCWHQSNKQTERLAWLTWYTANGAKIGDSTKFEIPGPEGVYVSPVVVAPKGTATVRIAIGGKNTGKSTTYIRFKDVMLVEKGESTDPFSGDSGTDFYWTGTVNHSESVYHPPQDITVHTTKVGIQAATALYGAINVGGIGASRAITLDIRLYAKDESYLSQGTDSGTAPADTLGTRFSASSAGHASAVLGRIHLTIHGVTRGQKFLVDAAMIETGTGTLGSYFDGSSANTSTTTHQWVHPTAPHGSASSQHTVGAPLTQPIPETPTAETLVASGGAAANTYKLGMFYTFENEVGESAPSKITEIRVSRPWSDWQWESPNAAGEPSGTYTEIAEKCADQITAQIPAEVYAQAVAEGAVRWNLYVIAWSDQEPVPVVALQAREVDLYSDPSVAAGSALPYEDGGWVALTPSRKVGLDEQILPTPQNRSNYSRPPHARNGIVAGDRIIFVGDPTDLASVRWSSNQMGEYINLTASKGGGIKTLVSGNLYVPAAVKLWQNPQSVDTLTILCLGVDGRSTSYYMQPATISGQSSTTQIMGFEETTNTPGTVSPYGVEVLNNAMFRPTEKELLKSTASNYNINHKPQSDLIQNMWIDLDSKEKITSAVLDNRLYYLVNNPYGEVLEDGCFGNEIWIFDISSDGGSWSRVLVQGAFMRPIDVGNQVYMSLTRPDGLYYFDPEAREDDYVAEDGTVLQRPIEWYFETNTQGANRAHDAWAHLQQVGVIFGDFKGTAQFGIRGWTLHGQPLDMSKETTYEVDLTEDNLLSDVEDVLMIRRDMKEWIFYAGSVEGKYSHGQIGIVQYRYTPVSVNVGYEWGTVESYEYGSNVENGNDAYSVNGVPLPNIDQRRP